MLEMEMIAARVDTIPDVFLEFHPLCGCDVLSSFWVNDDDDDYDDVVALVVVDFV